MAKISNNTVNVYHKDIQENYDIVIMYNQTYKFYAVIPVAFSDLVHHLGPDERVKYNISEKRESCLITYVITSETERACLDKMKDCLSYLTDKKIERRNVIIVFFKGDETTYYNNHLYNIQHPQITFKFGLTYAVETSVGSKKVYNMYTPAGHRKELNLWNDAATVIPDTEYNRAILEELYNRINVLRNRLVDFTKDSETLLAVMASMPKGIELT